jgi:hypothetical protein
MNSPALRNMEVKNKKSVHRVPITFVNYQNNEAPKRERRDKDFCETIAIKGCEQKKKVPVKIKREEVELKKTRRKYVTKFEEIIIQETKEDIIEERCESCDMFQSARTLENINIDTKKRVIPVQIKLNDTQAAKKYEKSKQIFTNWEEDIEEKERKVKPIKEKPVMINSVEVNFGKPARISEESMKANRKDETNSTDLEQKQQTSMLDKPAADFQLVVSFSQRKP